MSCARGYGIFYDGSIYSRMVANMLDQPPFATASTLTANPEQVLTLEDGFPAQSANTIHNTYAADSNFRRPYAQSWNFIMEDELFRNVILSVGYVGTKGTKLDLLLSPNSCESQRFRVRSKPPSPASNSFSMKPPARRRSTTGSRSPCGGSSTAAFP